MTREQLEHVLRAASQIAAERDVLVIGSQSLLGSFAEDRLPHSATTYPWRSYSRGMKA